MQIIPPRPVAVAPVKPYREPVNNLALYTPDYLGGLYATDKYLTGTALYRYYIFEIPSLRLIDYIVHNADYVEPVMAPLSKNNDYILTIEKFGDMYYIVKRRIEDLTIMAQEPVLPNLYYFFIFNITEDNNYFLTAYCVDESTRYFIVQIRRTSDLSVVSSLRLPDYNYIYYAGWISKNYVALVFYSRLVLYDWSFNEVGSITFNGRLSRGIGKVVIDESNNWLVAVDYNGIASMYRIPDLTLVKVFNGWDSERYSFSGFDLSRDGRYLALAESYYGVFVVDLKSHTYSKDLIFGGHNKCFGIPTHSTVVTFSSDGKYLIGCAQNYDWSNLFVWNIEPFKFKNDWVFT